MSSPTQMLTARLTPVPGQALDCYLEHVAALNYLTTADLLTRLRALIPDASSPSFVQQTVLSPTSSELHAITALTGADPDQLHTAALASHAGTAFDLTGYDRTHVQLPQRRSPRLGPHPDPQPRLLALPR